MIEQRRAVILEQRRLRVVGKWERAKESDPWKFEIVTEKSTRNDSMGFPVWEPELSARALDVLGEDTSSALKRLVRETSGMTFDAPPPHAQEPGVSRAPDPPADPPGPGSEETG